MDKLTRTKPAPLIDIMAINAVESLFHKYKRDPWAMAMAAKMADFCIYSDQARYPIVRPDRVAYDEDRQTVPALLNDLIERDPGMFKEERIVTDGYLNISPELLAPAFDHFYAYAFNHPTNIRHYIESHNASWLRPQYTLRLPKHYVFPVEMLQELSSFQQLAAHLRVDEHGLCYLFDLVLRYPLYGGLAGADGYYLSHPLREEQNFPTMEQQTGPPPAIPLRLGPSIAAIAPHLERQEFADLIQQARNLVREKHIVKLKPGSVGIEARREIARSLKLPARLRAPGRVAVMSTFTTGILSAVSAYPVLTPGAVILGGAVTVATTFWQKPVPGWLATWCPWAVTYDLEQEAKEHQQD